MKPNMKLLTTVVVGTLLGSSVMLGVLGIEDWWSIIAGLAIGYLLGLLLISWIGKE